MDKKERSKQNTSRHAVRKWINKRGGKALGKSKRDKEFMAELESLLYLLSDNYWV